MLRRLHSTYAGRPQIQTSAHGRGQRACAHAGFAHFRSRIRSKPCFHGAKPTSAFRALENELTVMRKSYCEHARIRHEPIAASKRQHGDAPNTAS